MRGKNGRRGANSIRPDKHVAINSHVIEPFEAKNLTEFELAQKDGGVEVNWVMSGDTNFMAKAEAPATSKESRLFLRIPS